jgi:rhodanese-related sulfurtransferase
LRRAIGERKFEIGISIGGAVGSKLEIDVHELQQELDSGHDLQLVDVREGWEHALVRLPGSVLLPLHELGTRLSELDASRPTVVYCHHGIRSMHAALALASQGFAEVRSLRGGIHRWATEIDPSMPRY